MLCSGFPVYMRPASPGGKGRRMSRSSYYKSKDALFMRLAREIVIMLAVDIEPIDILKYCVEEFNAWKAERVYTSHNVLHSDIYIEKNNGQDVIETSINQLDIQQDGFLGSIENEKLYHALRGLKADEISLLEACVINGVPQKEYAARIGRSNSTVNERLKRILKRLKTTIE